MNKSKYLIIVLSVFLLTSCATMVLSPQEVKMMTTKQFNTNKDLVFRSVISLLQSESYLIENTDKETGLVRAYKRKENEYAEVLRELVGSSTDARTSKVVFFVEEFNSSLTEVKITLYEGTVSTSVDEGHENKEVKESMVYSAEIYNKWFNNLRAEIERRKALTQ